MFFHSLEEIKLTDKDFEEPWRFTVESINGKYFLTYISDNFDLYFAEVPLEYITTKFKDFDMSYINHYGLDVKFKENLDEKEFIKNMLTELYNKYLESVVTAANGLKTQLISIYGCNHQQSLVNQGIHWCDLNNVNYPNCDGCKDFSKRPDAITYYK